MKIDMHIEKLSFFVSAWTFFLDSEVGTGGRPHKDMAENIVWNILNGRKHLPEGRSQIQYM